MRLTIRLLGTEVFHVDTDALTPVPDGPGESTSYPLGFTPQHGDQRWQPGGEP